MWTQREVEDANAAAQAARSVDELSFQTKATVKAGGVMRSFDNDHGGRHIFLSQILTQPLQRNLNLVMKADKASGKLTHAATTGLTGEDFRAFFTECCKLNYKFVSGSCGRSVLSGYADMITNLDSNQWQGWRMNDTDKLDAAYLALTAASGAWRRLVFYFEDPRFRIFELCTQDSGSEFNYSADSVFNSLTALKGRQTCRACFDDSFAAEMVRFFDSDPEKAHAHLTGVLAHLRMGSASAERRHLHGQSLKPIKSRGVAVDATNLSVNTYVQSAVQEAKLNSDMVHKAVLGRYGMTLNQYHALSRRFRLDGSRQSSKDSQHVEVTTLEKAAKANKDTVAYQRFRSEKWSCHSPVGSQEFVAEERRIKDLWAITTDDDKALYRGHVAAMSETVANVLGDLTIANIESARPQLGDNRCKLLMQKLFIQVFQDIESHAAWDAGLGIASSSSALRPDKVDARIAEATCRDKIKSAFGYDEKVVDNPPGTAIPTRSCHSKNWGVCSLDRWLPAARFGVENIYKLLKRWNIRRDMLPATASFSLHGTVNHYVIADTFGKGEAIFLLRLEPTGVHDTFKPLVVVERGFRHIASMTGQMAIRGFAIRCGLDPLVVAA
eukprot:9504106-Pyramimonas_sp.AAC.1